VLDRNLVIADPSRVGDPSKTSIKRNVAEILLTFVSNIICDILNPNVAEILNPIFL